MKTFLFKPEDFSDRRSFAAEVGGGADIANLANHILEKNGVRVSRPENGDWTTDGVYPHHIQKALLVCIEELPKKECAHEKIIVPYNCNFQEAMKNVVCADCHKSLEVGKWEAKK